MPVRIAAIGRFNLPPRDREVGLILEDSMEIAAPSQAVWDFLLDIERSAACVPGVEQISLVDERTFDGVIEARVGPIAGHFSFRAHIVESDPPTRLTAEVNGTDSVTKSTLRMDVDMTLQSDAPERTTIAHRAVVDVKGRLAILGDMILRATAVLVLEEFTKRLRAELEHQPA